MLHSLVTSASLFHKPYKAQSKFVVAKYRFSIPIRTYKSDSV